MTGTSYDESSEEKSFGRERATRVASPGWMLEMSSDSDHTARLRDRRLHERRPALDQGSALWKREVVSRHDQDHDGNARSMLLHPSSPAC